MPEEAVIDSPRSETDPSIVQTTERTVPQPEHSPLPAPTIEQLAQQTLARLKREYGILPSTEKQRSLPFAMLPVVGGFGLRRLIVRNPTERAIKHAKKGLITTPLQEASKYVAPALGSAAITAGLTIAGGAIKRCLGERAASVYLNHAPGAPGKLETIGKLLGRNVERKLIGNTLGLSPSRRLRNVIELQRDGHLTEQVQLLMKSVKGRKEVKQMLYATMHHALAREAEETFGIPPTTTQQETRQKLQIDTRDKVNGLTRSILDAAGNGHAPQLLRQVERQLKEREKATYWKGKVIETGFNVVRSLAFAGIGEWMLSSAIPGLTNFFRHDSPGLITDITGTKLPVINASLSDAGNAAGKEITQVSNQISSTFTPEVVTGHTAGHEAIYGQADALNTVRNALNDITKHIPPPPNLGEVGKQVSQQPLLQGAGKLANQGEQFLGNEWKDISKNISKQLNSSGVKR